MPFATTGDLPDPGIKPKSAGTVLTTEPPGKPLTLVKKHSIPGQWRVRQWRWSPAPYQVFRLRVVLVPLSACRSGPFEVRADLEESMEFVDPGVAGESDESGDEHVSDEETDLGTDWENLPSPRFCDIPSQPVEVSQSQSSQASPPIASSSAGGMISSAAASVTSWFKAYTGHR